MDENHVEPHRTRLVLAWLIHPATLLALVLLIVNDHLLKSAYPGLLTGKLSDAAGLLVAPPVLALALTPVIPRRWSPETATVTALALTGAGLTVVKATTTGAETASALWSVLVGPSVILADPTDLVTLPALGVAWWVWTRARSRPVTRLAVRRLGTLVALPTATLAMVATPAPDYPDVVAVGSWNGMLVSAEVNAYHSNPRLDTWSVSTDGLSWRIISRIEQAEFDLVRATLSLQAEQSCVPRLPTRCYRVVPGHLRVEETSDGGSTWKTSWEVPDGRRRYLARQYDELHAVDRYLSSVAVAVHPVAGGGHVVVVANRRDGYARRDVSGRWERIGFGASTSGVKAKPPPLADDPQVAWGELTAALLLGLIVLAVGAWRAAVGAGQAIGASQGLFLAGAPTALLGIVAVNYTEFVTRLLAVVVVFLSGSALALTGTVGTVIRARRAAPAATGWFGPVLLAALGVAAGWAAAFLGWVAGIYAYRLAALLACLVVVLGLVLAVQAGGRARAGRREQTGRPEQTGTRPDRT